jgi:HEAT repeat protein
MTSRFRYAGFEQCGTFAREIADLIVMWRTEYDRAANTDNLYAGDWDYFERIAIALAFKGDTGAEFLLGELPPESSMRGAALLVGIAESNLDRNLKCKILIENVHHPDPWVKGDALHGLTKLAYVEGRPDAEAMVDHEHEYVRRRAIHYLTELFPLETVHLLEQGLNDQSDTVREAVIDRIDESPEPSIPPMFEDRIWPLVEQDDFGVRFKAIYYLQNHCLGESHGRLIPRTPEGTTLRAQIVSVYIAYDREDWDEVAEYARHPSALVRREAAHWIRSNGMWCQRVGDEVIERLRNDPDERVRAEIAD